MMPRIYEGATVTLSVASASGCGHGFLEDRNQVREVIDDSEHTTADEVEVKDDGEKYKEMHFCVRPGCRVKELLEGCKSLGRTLNVCVNRNARNAFQLRMKLSEFEHVIYCLI
jgi:hypothetical protein